MILKWVMISPNVKIGIKYCQIKWTNSSNLLVLLSSLLSTAYHLDQVSLSATLIKSQWFVNLLSRNTDLLRVHQLHICSQGLKNNSVREKMMLIVQYESLRRLGNSFFTNVRQWPRKFLEPLVYDHSMHSDTIYSNT